MDNNRKLRGVKKWAIFLITVCSFFLFLQLSSSHVDFANRYRSMALFAHPSSHQGAAQQRTINSVQVQQAEKRQEKQAEAATTARQVDANVKVVTVANVEEWREVETTSRQQEGREGTTTQQEDTTAKRVETTTKEKEKTTKRAETTTKQKETTTEQKKITTNQEETTTKGDEATTTKVERSKFSYVAGMYRMDKHLKLPPPVSLRPDSNEPLLNYSQRRDYARLIGAEELCEGEDVLLLMVVKSSCAMDQRRDAVRRTWADREWTKRELGADMRAVFLLGRCTSDEMQEKLERESADHGDILQWDFHDSFRNLTLKEVLFLQWYTRSCRNVPFVFKGDDDVFVNTRNVIDYVRHQRGKPDLFVGSRLEGSPRILDPTWKYYVSYNLYPHKYYPPYVSGGGFIMSGSLAVRLFSASLRLPIFPIDDAFVGTLLKEVGVDPKNDRRFKSWGVKQPSPCHLSKLFTYHKSLPQTLLRQWRDVTELDQSTCDQRYDVMRSQTEK